MQEVPYQRYKVYNVTRTVSFGKILEYVKDNLPGEVFQRLVVEHGSVSPHAYVWQYMNSTFDTTSLD
jgi:hypothetical protein